MATQTIAPLLPFLKSTIQWLYAGRIVFPMLPLLLLMPAAFAQSPTDCYPEGVTFRNQSEIDQFSEEHPACTHIIGDLNIDESIDYAISSLEGLSQLTSVGGRLYLHWNQGLTTLQGLHNIHTIGRYLYLYDMDGLISLEGLHGLQTIGEDMYLSQNNVLQRLEGLEHLREIGGYIYLGYNFLLTDITALSGLHSIGERIELIYNSALSSLAGLENIELSGITELVLFNASLESCHVSSICQYLENPENNASLGGNAEGCTTRAEILSACEAQYVDVSQQYQPGWNLAELPVNRFHSSVVDLFPGILEGTLFRFDGGYIPAQQMIPGQGYWLRLPDMSDRTFRGNELRSDLWQVQEGWNLVSGLSTKSVPVDSSGILVPGSLFSFDGGYIAADRLEAGKGYWVAAYENGYVEVHGGEEGGVGLSGVSGVGGVAGAIRPTGAPAKTHAKPKMKIDFWQRDRLLRTLFVLDRSQDGRTSKDGSTSLEGPTSLDGLHPLEGALPPLPPAGSFDARFPDNRTISMASDDIRVMIQLPSTKEDQPVYLRMTHNGDGIQANELQANVLQTNEHEVLFLNDVGRVLARAPLMQNQRIPIPSETAEMRFHQPETKPSKVSSPALHPNYPNPFNPSTIISYSLPEASLVRLDVYNVAGQHVASLVNGTKSAGNHEVQFDATQLASGVYFYTLKTGADGAGDGFGSQVRRMVLMK